MNLFLIGMPAAGKSFWLPHFANVFKIEALDLDELVEIKYRQSITQLIKQKESLFRTKETTVLKQIIRTKNNFVLAAGGGTPCFHNNMEMMREKGKIIYIKSSIESILIHLQQSKTVRPLLANTTIGALKINLQKIFTERRQYFEQADLIFDTDNDSFSDIVQQISSSARKQI